MNARARTLIVGAIAALTLPPLCAGQSGPPVIFYSDLESGPNSGGENNAGAYVTIYGKNFGATRGSSLVTIGGGTAAGFAIWTDGKVTLQLGGNAQTGVIQLTTPAGTSNGVPFTVRAGNIHFISNSGNDSASGSFATPWKTILQARNMAAGDITYAMDGVAQTTDDGTGWSAALTLGAQDCGTGLPRALVAYPNASVTLGNINSPANGIRASNPSSRGGVCQGGWVFAGLLLRGQVAAVALEGPSSNWRVVGNDVTCPNGDGADACFETSQASVISLFGNNVHDTGAANASAEYQGVYFSTDSNHIQMAWNTVANIHGCRGVQIHSSPLNGGGANDPTGHNQYDLHIHDNLIHDTQCDGIVFATVDPSQGTVEAYNNVIYNAGQGPNNPEHTGNWSCIYAAGDTNTGLPGGGTVEIYNNTLDNCGSFAHPPYPDSRGGVMNGGGNPKLQVRIRNNIINTPSSVPYVLIDSGSNTCSDSQNCPGVYGANNLFFGNGSAPLNTNITSSIGADPLFVNASAANFHLLSGSPAISTGVNTGLATDFDGQARGNSFDLGAYQFAASAVTPLAELSVSQPTVLTSIQTTSVIETLSNTGQASASFTAAANQSWIGVSPSSGTVNAGSLQTFTLTVNGVGLSPGVHTGTVTITGGSNGPQLISVTLALNAPLLLSLRNAASYQNLALSPGEIVSAFGSLLGPATGVGTSAASLPTTLGNTQLMIGGVAAPLLYTQSNQINAVVPQSVEGQSSVEVHAVYQGVASNSIPLAVAQASPGVFTDDFSGQGQAVALNSNGVLNTLGTPAARGSTVSIFVTGLGLTNPNFTDGQTMTVAAPVSTTPQVTIGGVSVNITFAGLVPGFLAGIYRIDATVPTAIPAGTTNLIVTSAGTASATVTLAVQ